MGKKSKEVFVTLIPKSSLIERYGQIPEQLEINTQAWKDYWEKKSSDNSIKPDWEDALTINWWENVPASVDKISSELDKLLTKVTTNEVNIRWEKKNWFLGTVKFWAHVQDEQIRELVLSTTTVRVNPILINNVLNIFNHYDVLLMDKHGGLSPSEWNSVKDLMK